MDIKKKEIQFPYDLFGRYAANLVYAFEALPFEIWIVKNDIKVNAKSFIGVLSSAIRHGETITVYVNGSNDDLQKVIDLIFE